MQHPAGRLLCNTQHAIRSRTIIRSLPAWRLFSYNSPSRSQELKFKAIESLDSGSLARTNDEINLEYTGEHDLERSTPVHGHRILHSKRTLPCFSMDGKVVVVTGGARGLGLVMSQGLVESGAEVAICDLNRDEAERQAEELTAALRRESPAADIPRISGHFCDVSSPRSIEDCMQAVIRHHDKVDSLVTSAGFTENFRAEQYPYERLQKLWGVNVDGTYLFATAFARHLMQRQAPGSMVFIGSMSGSIVNVPQPQAPYNAAKAAVRHLAASFAVEWATANIRVNCISPGYMLTPLTKKILAENPELKEKWISLIPQGRMGDPEDLIGAVVFLASDASKYVTGADLRVDGGYTVT